MQVNILAAKNRLSQLVKSAQAGEEVIIANRGVPVARLIATGAGNTGTGDAQPGGVLAWLAQHPLPAHARRSHEAIEAALNEERAGWE
ncbi:type II toxin-antitoxin system prevent-host-death family antitoxin [Uliginosibacterium sediminicola]|uniref:Antitoxin n=1 Tax=Uliginosibacterium sediminicola TaxID=2024550 RepID=A0ABU9Z3U0_9RHOO